MEQSKSSSGGLAASSVYTSIMFTCHLGSGNGCRQQELTLNCVSNMVTPVSGTTSLNSFTFFLSSGALMELSPHIIASNREL